MPVLPACFYPLRPGRSPSHYWLPVGRERNASTRQHQVRTSLCFRTCTPCSVQPWIITFLDSGARAVVVCTSRHRTLRRRHTGRFTSNASKLRETTRTPFARTSAIPSKARMLVVIALLQRLVSVYSGSSLRILSEWINTMPQSGSVLLLTFFSLARSPMFQHCFSQCCQILPRSGPWAALNQAGKARAKRSFCLFGREGGKRRRHLHQLMLLS